MTPLLDALLELLHRWDESFPQQRTFARAVRLALDRLRQLREDFDAAGAADKDLLVALDGGFCNRVFFGGVPQRVELVVRCRKDAKLHSGAQPADRRFYSKDSFTPESVRTDEGRPYTSGCFFHGGDWRQIRYKEVTGVFWPHGARRRPLRLIILAPTPYRNSPNGVAHRDNRGVFVRDKKWD